ncbi:FAD-dependent oxidoreductase [Streptomyces sp. NPDC053048]|uniref:FAD-dependent oxidoreductase n=1 Tax=Streptomyces sp. NPDC053048 TaxID=3365694 RepID=UPI0037CDFD70
MSRPDGPGAPPPPGVAESYWMATAPAAPRAAALTSDIEVDVAVVGAGMAGLSTAWELIEAGRSVAVLEADRLAAGVSGYTTAKLSALHTLVYDRLRRTRGAEGARLYALSQREAVERVAEVAAALRADCDLERLPAVTYTTDPAQRERLRAEAEAAREAGLAASYTEETGLPFPVAGAVRAEDQAQFHPRRYLLALAEDIRERGGLLYERTRVTGLSEGTPCRLTTENGSVVTARDVIVATHYPVFDRALLFTRLSPRRELAVAAVIPAGDDPGGMYITEEDRTRSVRTAPYDEGRRLIIVTGEKFTPGAGEVAERFARLAAWTTGHFPRAEFAHHWAAQDNDSTDTVPLVGPFHPGAAHTYVATGFGGWGMSGGAMAGRLLTELITGRGAPSWAGLYDPRRLWSTVREAPAFLKHQAAVGRHFVGDRLRTTHTDAVADIPPGGGAVVRVGGRRCAVHRAEDGTVHALSAICTHMGCLVAFNAAERTWECPCHGSRFAVDGTVLQGPATRPLEVRELPGE